MVDETKTVKDLNPRAQAVKSLESTVLRCLQLIDAFDALESGLDWTDVPGGTYRKVLGNRYEYPRILEEVYKRWKSGRIYTEVLDLYENLPPAAQKRKEIQVGIRKIRKRLDQ